MTTQKTKARVQFKPLYFTVRSYKGNEQAIQNDSTLLKICKPDLNEHFIAKKANNHSKTCCMLLLLLKFASLPTCISIKKTGLMKLRYM